VRIYHTLLPLSPANVNVNTNVNVINHDRDHDHTAGANNDPLANLMQPSSPFS